MRIPFLRQILLVVLLHVSFIAAEDVLIRRLISINATELLLANGMKICLKPTDFESDEVLFKFGALGGYGALDANDRASGEISVAAAWESGMGSMSSDQVSVYLYEHMLEFELKLMPFCRIIEGVGKKSEIGSFLCCVDLLFTQQKFTKEGSESAIREAKTILGKKANDYDCAYEAEFLKVNTEGLPPLRPLRVEDLSKVDFDKARQIFHRSFSNPSEFTCIIVGNFDVGKVIGLVKKHLGEIKSQSGLSGLNKPIKAPFPTGITEASICVGNHPGALTRLTFPMQVKVEEKNIHEISFICQVIEARLRNLIREKMALSYGVDVSYEFPVYPYLNNPWVSIRFRSEQQRVQEIKKVILEELKHLQADGVDPREVDLIKKLELGCQEFWLKDNFYWVSMLTNYYLWGWNPERVDYKNTSLMELSATSVNGMLKQLISLSNYSEITATSK